MFPDTLLGLSIGITPFVGFLSIGLFHSLCMILSSQSQISVMGEWTAQNGSLRIFILSMGIVLIVGYRYCGVNVCRCAKFAIFICLEQCLSRHFRCLGCCRRWWWWLLFRGGWASRALSEECCWLSLVRRIVGWFFLVFGLIQWTMVEIGWQSLCLGPLLSVLARWNTLFLGRNLWNFS